MQLTDYIYTDLFLAILHGEFQPGDRFLTEQEACERFHASRITVRRVYARLENEHVILRKQRVGTIVNNTFTAGKGEIRMIGVLLSTDDHFSRRFMNALCSAASRRDVVAALEPCNSGEEENRAVIRLVRHGIRDIVVWGIDRGLDMNLFFRLRLLGVNLVFFDRINPGSIADYVVLDNFAAIESLIQKAGAMKITKIFFADSAGLKVDTSVERHNACLEMCRKYGLEYSEELPETFPEHSAVLAINDPEALKFAGCGVPVFSIDGTRECLAKGIVSYPQSMERMAEMCFRSLQDQRKLGAKWKPRQFRIKQEPEQ